MEIILDTIAIESTSISENLAEAIEQFSTKYQGVDIKTGSILYQFTRSQLIGSYDSRISIQIDRERWVDDTVQHLRTGKKSMVKQSCAPYLRVECSAHKLIMGHNLFGGPTDFQMTAKYIVNFLEKMMNVKLPDYRTWFVRRIDNAEIFDLGSFEAVEEFFRGINRSSFPRREAKVGRWGNQSLNIAGRTTTVKAYHKGPEFWKNDYKRVCKFMGKEKTGELLKFANTIVRFEVEIHSRKLKDDNGGILPTVAEIKNEYILNIYDREVGKLIRDSAKEAKLCRTAEAVEKRLNQLYSSDSASRLLGTWFRLAAHGESFVKGSMNKATFYRHRKMLIDSGVSWTATDVILKEFSLVPPGFVPLTQDSRRLNFIDPIVLKALEGVA